ncbi:helicase-related protein [Rothia sp. ZJ932]|uniref:helicase-related protein n=1 Tax=Rothia sp. ZJ932 TaxID=2810516 RepID=UPI001966E5A4|nr:helicase-related protein [Rothia sp. ZJ932]QRZ61804.1 helicase [Rothia sp. ZJ932]
MTGVELDPISAAISQKIYPHAQIRQESFADTFIPENYFDATIGNVPFSQSILHDPKHNANRHSMHNHFIIKSLALTKPGGVVAVISSTFTMDTKNPAARQEIYKTADLLGAYRLPEKAFSRSAGTSVMTDVLIFRKRPADQKPLSDTWITVSEKQNGEYIYYRNDYFDDPSRLLGTADYGLDRWGNIRETIISSDLSQTAHLLHQAIHKDITAAQEAGYTYSAAPSTIAPGVPLLPSTEKLMEGHITDQGDGTFTIYSEGIQQPLKVPSTQRQELSALLSLRDHGRALLEQEARQSVDTPAITASRAALKDSYEKYVQRYGPINRYTQSQTANGNIIRRSAPVMSLLTKDPYGAFVTALEGFDNTTQSAKPSDLMLHRVLEPRTVATTADNIDDALSLCLDQRGQLDLPYISKLLNISEQESIQRLDDRIFLDPQHPEKPIYLTREEYLSGDVRQKLEQAQHAAAQDPRFERNVQALIPVIPRDLTASQIDAKIGAVWIDEKYHQQFLREVLGDTRGIMKRISGAQWVYQGAKYNRGGWGTEHYPPYKLLGYIAEQRKISVSSLDEQGKRVLNQVATQKALERAEKIRERFRTWLWEDPERASHLTQKYNRMFNNLAPRDYSKAGKNLSLPGLVKTFAPRDHQRSAVARMIQEPSVGLFHQVGAGKTAVMVMGTMELKRLGLVNKPCVVVPNHMLEQFGREWLTMYPQAKLLLGSSEAVTKKNLKSFVAKVATSNWDAVIMTHSAFTRVGVSNARKAQYIGQEVALTKEGIERFNERANDAARRAASRRIKQIEATLQRDEEQRKTLMNAPKIDGISFEESGIDYLCIDEMHEFKNLKTVSHISDANIEGASKASDLHMKVQYLRQEYGDRVITAATGTPIANSIAEMHVMKRFLAPQLLEQNNMVDFDSWAATFGQTVSAMEMTVAGGDSYHLKTRFAQFQNVPELSAMFRSFGDVKLASDLDLPTPDIALNSKGERAPEVLVLPQNDMQKIFSKHLDYRLKQLSGGPSEGADNPLVILSDGRKLALDTRLIDPALSVPHMDTKATRTAQLLAQVYRKYEHQEYLAGNGQSIHDRKGALQIVFCDLGAPSEDKFSVYQELKDQCVMQGIPEEKVRFIHEAANDVQKARLFEQCRSGEVAVLIGSTKKMGVGTNIQDRLVHMVHLDVPWRPADMEQRNGRILRQGNQNDEVMLTHVCTEKSVDVVMLQTVERKKKFINQLLSGTLTERTIEDIGSSAEDYERFKAEVSGNPLELRKADLRRKLTELELSESGHRVEQNQLQFEVSSLASSIPRRQEALEDIQRILPKLRSTAGDLFTMRVNDWSGDKRVDALAQMGQWAQRELSSRRPSMVSETDLGTFASLGGLEFKAVLGKRNYSEMAQTPVDIRVVGAEHLRVESSLAEFSSPSLGLVTRMENLVQRLPHRAEVLESELTCDRKTLDSLRSRVGTSFDRAAELEEVRREYQKVLKEHKAYQKSHLASSKSKAGGSVSCFAQDVLVKVNQVITRRSGSQTIPQEMKIAPEIHQSQPRQQMM